MTGDGLPDIVSASQGSVVSLLRNRGHRSFSAALNVPTGSDGEALTGSVISDLNSDGFPDVASVSVNVGRASAGTVSVLINNGGQGFLPPALYPQDQRPHSIAAGDVDGDGYPDLAVTLFDPLSGELEIGIMRNAGDGTFGAPVIFPAPRSNGPSELIDLNGDSLNDLVVLDQSSSVLGVLLGDGNGDFETESEYPAGTVAVSLAVEDVNGDARPDAIVGGQRNSSLLVNNADGTFAPATPLDLDAGGGSSYVAPADLQSDGNEDIAAVTTSGWFTPLFGRGDGTFKRGRRFAAGVGQGIAAGDLDGDGRPDVAVIGSGGSVTALFGAQGGRFLAAPVLLLATPLQAGILASTDLSGDGLPDLALGGGTGGSDPRGATPARSLFVSINQGGGRFGPSTGYAVPWDPTGIGSADFNGDGVVDIAASLGANDSQNVAILLGTGGGSFSQPSLISMPDFPAGIVAGDFTGDSVIDIGLAIFNSGTQTPEVTVLPGIGDGTFGSPITTNLGADETLGISADHLDGGPTLDVALLTLNTQGTDAASVISALGNGSGTFSSVHKYGVGKGRGRVATADLDGDGFVDVAASVPDSNSVATLLGAGDGTFVPGPTASVGTSPNWFSLADFTKDGIPDLVVADRTGLLWSMGGSGDGSFGARVTFATSGGPLAAADLDGNGALDVAEAQTFNLVVSLYLGLS